MTLQAEFQAVVLAAGKGSRIPEITTGKSKCLLPVGTKPLVWYPLYKLQQSGFTEVILVVLENQKSEIQAVLDKSDLEIKIDYFTINGKEDYGTADALRMLNDKLKSDVLIFSCDLITDVNLRGVLDLFRMHEATVASLFFHPQPPETVTVPGPKSKHKPERDLIGIDSQTNRLVFLASASDFETDLTLPRSLLKKHTHIKMYSSLVDSHIYVLKNWVVKYLNSQGSISTLKGELLPHIVKKQLVKAPKTVEGKSIVSKCENEDIFLFSREEMDSIAIRETSSFNDHIGDLKNAYHNDSIRCYALIAPKDTFGVRINTLPAYWSINGKISEKWEKITSEVDFLKRHPNSEVKSSQVDEKCVIWEGTKLHEKTSFKNALIGSNSEVSSFSRVFNSIIMNNVTIKEKVALENCIVSDGAIIEKGCNIKNCLIGSNYTVPEESEHSQEVLTDSDRLMEF